MSYRVDTVSNISYVSGMNRSAFSGLNRHISSNVSDRSCLISEVSALEMRGIERRHIETSSESDSSKELMANDQVLEEVKIADMLEEDNEPQTQKHSTKPLGESPLIAERPPKVKVSSSYLKASRRLRS